MSPAKVHVSLGKNELKQNKRVLIQSLFFFICMLCHTKSPDFIFLNFISFLKGDHKFALSFHVNFQLGYPIRAWICACIYRYKYKKTMASTYHYLLHCSIPLSFPCRFCQFFLIQALKHLMTFYLFANIFCFFS